jgi:hypothetical protein
MDDHPSRLASSALANLPFELAARVESELQAGENLVWVGQPRPDLYAKGAGCLVVFGIFFTGFSVIWLLLTFGIGFLFFEFGGGGLEFTGIPLFVLGLLGLPLLVIGIGLMTSPIWRRQQARRICYVLTDRRAIAWEPRLLRSVTVRSYNSAGLGTLTRDENPDGSGSLVFHEYADSDGSMTHRHGFICIDNVRSVEELVRRTLLDVV